MKRNPRHDADGSDISDGSEGAQASASTGASEVPAPEAKRLRARRRFLRAGVGGSAAVILSVYQRPTQARHRRRPEDDEKDKKKKTSIICEVGGHKGKQKVGRSVCASLRGQTKGYY